MADAPRTLKGKALAEHTRRMLATVTPREERVLRAIFGLPPMAGDEGPPPTAAQLRRWRKERGLNAKGEPKVTRG